MRFIVLGQNKANVCTNSAVMEELVCLSSEWNNLGASNPAEWEGDGDQTGRNGLVMVLLCHQKTVVAKWLGVEGRSSWPCDVSSPERLQRFNFSWLLLSEQLRPLFTDRLPLTVLFVSLLRSVLLLLLRHFYLTQILHVRHAGLLFKKNNICFLLAFTELQMWKSHSH